MDTMDEATIEVSAAHKRYGEAVALDGLSFTVTPGNVTGFVGPNGAGKSTTMRAILGLDRLDSDMSAAIAEAAGTLVAAALAVDDLTTARFAVEQGRLGTPHSEALIRAAMRVCAATGDREGLDRALRDARRLAQLLDPTGEPEPETVALYEELRHS